MDTFIDIEPFPVVRQATKIQMNIPTFLLNEKEMDVYVSMYNADGRFVDSHLVHIPPDVYATWGTDDNVIVDYVLAQLKILRKV